MYIENAEPNDVEAPQQKDNDFSSTSRHFDNGLHPSLIGLVQQSQDGRNLHFTLAKLSRRVCRQRRNECVTLRTVAHSLLKLTMDLCHNQRQQCQMSIIAFTTTTSANKSAAPVRRRQSCQTSS